jgi:outer membrane protein OmpA-like peptidoglycan-associated protein
MNFRRRLAALLVMLAATPAASCGPRRVPVPAAAPAASRDLIVLLPDGNDGTVGHAIVSNQAGAVTLAAAREATSVTERQPPAAVVVMSEADVQATFGALVSSLPPAAQHFTLYFVAQSNLTEESRAVVPQVLAAVRSRPAPDVEVIGHTDTTGTAASNLEVGLMRANAVRALLIAAGIDASIVEATSHGEADLLIETADEVVEPRNRRVEITVR